MPLPTVTASRDWSDGCDKSVWSVGSGAVIPAKEQPPESWAKLKLDKLAGALGRAAPATRVIKLAATRRSMMSRIYAEGVTEERVRCEEICGRLEFGVG